MTLNKPERKRRAIYITIADKSGPRTVTKNLAVYGGSLEKCERVVRKAFEQASSIDSPKSEASAS